MNLILVSFVAGFATVVTPCILPLVPLIIAGSVGNKLRPIAIVLGMSVTFAAMGIITSTISGTFAYYFSYFRLVADVVIIFLGILLVSENLNRRFIMISSTFINKIIPVQAHANAGPGIFGGFVLGLSLGVAWIPCAGPILGSVLTMVAMKNNILVGGLSLFSYSLGIGAPMLAIAYTGKFTSEKIKDFARYGEYVKKIAGAVLIFVGILMLLGIDRKIQALLLPYFPVIF